MIAVNQALLVLFLRIGLIALICLFMIMIVLAVRRDLIQTASRAGQGGGSPGLGPSGSGPRSALIASLVVINPGPTQLAAGHRFALRNPTVIGRGTTNDINLADDFVSNRHARLFLLGLVWHLEDLGTTNGTRLRGVALHGSSPLAPGDVFTIGRVDLRFEAQG